MPVRHIDQVNLDYYLVLFDRDGAERPEQDGTLLSAKLSEVVQDGVTDVFLSSHGWQGDIPAAIAQYNSWIGAMAARAADHSRARAIDPGFKSIVVGVHWPSLPWGNEDAPAALLGDDGMDEFTAELRMPPGELVQRYAERISGTAEARAALTTIVTAAGNDEVQAQVSQGRLPADIEEAYQTLFVAAGLGLDGPVAAPGSDQSVFSPSRTISEWTSATAGPANAPAGQPGLLDAGGPGLLGGGLRHRGGFQNHVANALLSPVRQLSFWAMKHRARRVGETGVHALLSKLQQSAPGARFHLMGHSFGCIVVCAAISGPLDQGAITSPPPRPVQSLFLVQGAMSLWSFAEEIPFAPDTPGYFRPIEVAPVLVTGPVVTTRSTFDHAVGTFYPLGAKLGRELLLGQELPEYGGVGAYGIQGTSTGATHDLPVLRADAEYGLEAGHIYNIEASRVICHGGWPSGAHSDIAHPEIAHLFWQAVACGMAQAGQSS